MSMSFYLPLDNEDLDNDTNQKMHKEVENSGAAADEMESQLISQPQRQKGGLITMPFIIGTLSLYLTFLKVIISKLFILKFIFKLFNKVLNKKKIK